LLEYIYLDRIYLLPHLLERIDHSFSRNAHIK
jgi:hypothetical protein